MKGSGKGWRPLLAMIFFAIVVLIFLLIGDNKKDKENQAKFQEYIAATFDGERPLRKMASVNTNNSKWGVSGSYFLIAGGISGSGNTQSNMEVYFSWKTKEGDFATSRLQLLKVRLNPVPKDKRVLPTISFVKQEKNPNFLFYKNAELQELMDKVVLYAVITCNEDDWPVSIELPMNARK